MAKKRSIDLKDCVFDGCRIQKCQDCGCLMAVENDIPNQVCGNCNSSPYEKKPGVKPKSSGHWSMMGPRREMRPIVDGQPLSVLPTYPGARIHKPCKG
jgi:hypothetical protein